MKKSKIVISVLTALMVLSFVFGAVLAQDEPPTRTLPDLSAFTPRVDEDAFPTTQVIVDGGPSQKVAPISPGYENVYTRTPKFYFLRDYRAEMYQIQVLDASSFVKIFSFKGAGVCENMFCYLQPTTSLKYHNYLGGDGIYIWSVRARVGGVWEPAYNPAYVPFAVISPGFTSTFDANMKKWNPVHGTWTLKNGALKTDGTPNAYASVFHRDIFNNYDLTAVMKRKFNANNTSGIIIGYPYPTYGTLKTWRSGVYFQYTNTKTWSLYAYDSGSYTHIANGTSSAIKPYDWNTLRVSVFNNYTDLWINGTYIGWVDIVNTNYGVVGLGMYRSNLAKEPLLVDSVTVTSIVYPTMAAHDPSMQLGQNPVELDGDPNNLEFSTGFGDPTGTR